MKTTGFLITLFFLIAVAVFGQVFSDQEYLFEVRIHDGSIVRGIVVTADSEILATVAAVMEQPESVTLPPGHTIVVKIAGGSEFVVLTDNITSIRRVRNDDYGDSYLTYDVLPEALNPADIEAAWWQTNTPRFSITPEAQIAGGTIAVGGYNFGFFNRRLQLSVLGGAGLAEGLKFAAAQRVTWSVLRTRVTPRVSAYAVEVTDFSKVAVAAGPSLGLAINFNGRVSSLFIDNAFTFNINPWIPQYVVYMPSLGVTF